MPKTPKKSQDFATKWAAIVKKTASDELFKQRLLKNPAQVLKDYGIEVPAGLTLKVVEDTPKTHYLILPEARLASELSEEELKKIAGGAIMSIGGSGSPPPFYTTDDTAQPL